MANVFPNLLFIINPGSGKKGFNWREEIELFFKGKSFTIDFFELPNPCEKDAIKKVISQKRPEKVVAVGGDGTVKLVAECIYNTPTVLGILPAGSANGMAKEFNISAEPQKALDILISGEHKKIHLVNINKEICIHLSDVGFNAFVVKKFQDENKRGMWGYVKAAWKVLWQHSKMQVEMKLSDRKVSVDASMVVIANATRYGNGVVINPSGTLFDDVFEVVVIKKISFKEIFKMRFTQKDFDSAKTDLYQTREIRLSAKSKVHFQVDGEYRGKVKGIHAELMPDALNVLIPREPT